MQSNRQADNRPMRRLGPRPLPLHLSLALASWSNSALILPGFNLVWQNLKEQEAQSGRPDRAASANHPPLPIPPSLKEMLAELGPQLDAADPAALAQALTEEGHRRLDAFLTGVLAYRRTDSSPTERTRAVLWSEGSTRLLDYRRKTASAENRIAPRVLVVPSLVNRYQILDLDPSISFLDYLAEAGFHPFVVDWDAPGSLERDFTLSDYIAGRLCRALDIVRQQEGGPIIVIGYCMGGLLALAASQLYRAGNDPAAKDLAGLALLATPWDFHAEAVGHARMVAALGRQLEPALQILDELPVDLLQVFFALLDPFLVTRKFQNFAALDRQDPTGSAAAGRFVALEDWLNDGVPLVTRVASECLINWYGDNTTMRGGWRVAGTAIDPKQLSIPCLAMVPSSDRIVPPGSALALGRLLPNCRIETPAAGHIGMMVGARAKTAIWPQIASWMRDVAGGP
ncbi:alpha/beta fold hydrolase [Dongia soli]|uniref:Alpha/beta fold hydrolase n=1 Tax=Dongia soli TaxID=600628 RepID=A0ABU5E662_9PROT|nr:alpha/beta fold hydrolase [Dongia soli]MDY0881377.1 alpha/beta fold hydrolase [Dongia soli]